MQAREVMSHPVVTVASDTPVEVAAEILTRQGFTALPVTDDDDRLVGIVSEADLLGDRIAPDPRSHGVIPHPRTTKKAVVGDVMTTPVESMTPGADAADIVSMMLDERIRCVPIVDGYQLVGVVTRRDLLRSAVIHNDNQLAQEISRQLTAFAGADRWNVTVQAGLARIEDHIDSAADRQIAERLAAAVPGVVAAQASYLTSDPF